MSGVAYIYYEIWWDSDFDKIFERIASEVRYSQVVSFKIQDYGTHIHEEILLMWFAVDNAGNIEYPHYQLHYVI